MVEFVAFVVAIAAAGALAAHLVRGLITRRHRQRGEVEAALSLDAADGDDGRRRWRHVVAVPMPGELRFRARSSSIGLRGRLRAEETLVVLSAEPDPGHRVRGRDLWTVNPRMRAATLDTPEGPVTLLLQPREMPSFLARLAQ